MNHDDGLRTVRCRGDPAVRRQWYSELARLIASTPLPAAALLESDSDGGPTRVTVRPSPLLDVLQRCPAGVSVRVDACPARAPAPPAELRHECAGDLVRAGRAGRGPPSEGALPLDRVGIVPGVPPGSWLGLQTFWLPGPHGSVWMARRFRLAASTAREATDGYSAVGPALAAEWSLALGVAATFAPCRWGFRRDWARGGLRTVPPLGWFDRPCTVAAHSALSLDAGVRDPSDALVETPAIVLGASGAGKTTFLARWAAQVVERGGALFALDLHGDLAPLLLARLSSDARRRMVAIDAERPPVPGVSALAADAPLDRAAAHLVAALKRLSPDGVDLYWGFRLERIFDTVVRLALESGGTLTDVYDLLTNPDRRESARLATRSPEIARFLDELAPVVRRNPEFLWSAATRLSKVVLVPALRELLAPVDGGVPVEALLTHGRSVVVRIPFATVGPEAAGFAATLALGRVYLGLASGVDPRRSPTPVTVVLDEVQALSPRLVTEVLSEGRKFGLRTVVATQYPERLARELAAAARGALRGFVTFRVPRPSALAVGAWFGLGPADSGDLLPNLPTGQGLALDSRSLAPRVIPPEELPAPADPTVWEAAVDATRVEFGRSAMEVGGELSADASTERLLLAVLWREESGARLEPADLVAAAAELPGPGVDPAALAQRVPSLFRERYLVETPEGLQLTSAGERRLGLTTATQAVRETAEHRALLMEAFRRFARRGYRLEILRQGRFDTTLPDARLRQLSDRNSSMTPAELASEIQRARSGWAWRFFHGRDVHVEAEVSGALRAERVRHGVRKAVRAGAFALFVVSDARRARRVRTVLRAMGLGVDRAQVWTLRLPDGSAG
ncbi:MAG TPA: hypothetical protein VMH38_03645 [Thermoplasmata archaeon]|nr:hypothetical protein [Thermoplasmata archaeon]